MLPVHLATFSQNSPLCTVPVGVGQRKNLCEIQRQKWGSAHALLRTFCISSRDGKMQRGWASPWHLCSPPLKSSHLLASWLTIASSPLQASLVAKMAKNLPAVQEARVWSLGQEDTLEKGKAAAFSPGEFHGQRSLSGYSPWGWKELDMTARLSTHIQTHS